MNAGELTYDFAQANSAVAAGPRAAGGSLRKARVPATSMRRAATRCRPLDLVEHESPGSSLSETELRELTLRDEACSGHHHRADREEHSHDTRSHFD